jgi:glycogen operon protein
MRPAIPTRLGATFDGEGTAFALWSDNADAVELCLLDEDLVETRFALPHRDGAVWHGYLAGVRPGQRYGFRVHGEWNPTGGALFNPHKLLVDPYAHRVDGALRHSPEIFGHRANDAAGSGDLLVMDERDSRLFVPHSVVTEAHARPSRRPAIPWTRTVIYEANVRALTARNPHIPEHERGTYAALAHESVIEHLHSLGVTALELLPIHHFVTEPHVAARGRVNLWGYNALAFSAPHAAYAATDDPISELRHTVDRLHDAGIELLLDVVYNHTAEGGALGPLLSFKGIDNRAYYRIDGHGRHEDLTGCGNTLDTRSPYVTRFISDSLRWWAEVIGVDGFRFDLMSAIARNDGGFDARASMLTVITQDPVLRELKLIAEPWDVSMDGYAVGRYGEPWREWNDRYRDTTRSFWLAPRSRNQGHIGIREIAYRIAGSSDIYSRRDPTASINFITAHDGFTMQDLVTWSRKYNEPNGEGNRDGSNSNMSWNCGVEGPTTDQHILDVRRRLHRSLMATLLLSAGIPMITMGDEVGRGQRGSNNAYTLSATGDPLQDWDGGWALPWEWEPWQRELLDTTRALATIRRDHPLLSQKEFFTGRINPATMRKDLAWFGADGQEVTEAAWHDPRVHTLGYHVETTGSEADSLLVILHAGAFETTFTLPAEPWASALKLVLDTRSGQPIDAVRVEAGTTVSVASHSVQVWLVEN